jgi:hypothetical protein
VALAALALDGVVGRAGAPEARTGADGVPGRPADPAGPVGGMPRDGRPRDWGGTDEGPELLLGWLAAVVAAGGAP